MAMFQTMSHVSVGIDDKGGLLALALALLGRLRLRVFLRKAGMP